MGIVSRNELFIQTKFTSKKGQDASNIPYDPNAPLEVQVYDCFKSYVSTFFPLSMLGYVVLKGSGVSPRKPV
jgi:hypothetical protein